MHIVMRIGLIRFIIVLSLIMPLPSYADSNIKKSYPRLFGINIGAKNYDDPKYQDELSKLDAVILGFYRGWKGKYARSIRGAVKNLKRRNPNMLIGQYTVLNEAYNNKDDIATMDKQDKLHKENWWLRNSKGEALQWTTNYSTWEINITHWAKPDESGLRYPEWLAERDNKVFFSQIPELDIWYFDNVMYKSRISQANWKGTGVDIPSDSDEVEQAYRKAHRAEWQTARRIAPKLIQIGNSDNNLSFPEYKGQLNGAFLECLMGKHWSIGTRQGWHAVMQRYRDALSNTVEPHLVVFHICGDMDDYRLFRFSFASSLLDDGWYAYTDEDKGYSSVPWFDEYEVELGKAVDPPAVKLDHDGLYKRKFEYGMVIVNPNPLLSVSTYIEAGYRRIKGKQVPELNTGLPVHKLTIAPQDGIVLILYSADEVIQ